LAKANAYIICIAPQAAYGCCRGAVHVTDRASVESIGRRLSPRPQTNLWPTSYTQPGLPFNGLHPRNRCNCMDYYSFNDPRGMEGWVCLVGWPV